MQSLIYLDYNATSPLRKEVKDAMFQVMGGPLNPSSIHASGRAARKLLEDARAKVLKSVNAKNLVFCSSGTEANNIALAQGENILVSAIEHDSVWKLKSSEFRVQNSGIIDLDDIENQLSSLQSPIPVVLSVMFANNETGIIQPVKDVVAIARKYGALIHCDAVQAYGKIPVDFADLGVDVMTISAHKIGGPVGAAALIFRDGLELKPIMKGGGQEKNKRPGTEDVVAIVGLGKLAEIIGFGRAVSRETWFEDELEKIGGKIVGKETPRLPNTTCVIHPNMEAATQLIALDMAGICVSSGSACSSGKVEVSRTLKAMGIEKAKNAIRISTGWATSRSELETFLAEYKKNSKANS